MHLPKHSVFRRGIVAVRSEPDPVKILSSLNDGFEDFKRRHRGDLEEIRMQIADIAARAASAGLGGTGSVDRDRSEVNSALRSFIKSNNKDGLAALAANASMSVGSDPDGGYTVYPTVSTDITRRVFESSPLRAYARTVTISTDSFEELLDLDEPDAAWVGEKQARPETGTPELGKLMIPAHEIYAMPKITQKLLDDSSIDLAAWLTDKVGAKFARQETSAFFTGDGILKPRGFLTYPTAATVDASRAWGTLQHVATGTTGGFLDVDVEGGDYPADCLIDLQTSLKGEYRANAIWLMNRRTAGVIRKFKDADGAYIWSNSTVAGQPSQLLGHSVVLCEDMPDIGENAFPVAFGDFGSGYTIVDRHGERVLRDPFSAKPNVLFYVYRRVGGDVNNFEAIKLLKVAAS
jgi:HK97 family phage major capsid protein